MNLFRLIVLRNGTLLGTDSPHDLKGKQSNYRTSFTNQFGEESQIRSRVSSDDDGIGNQSMSSQSSASGSIQAFNSMVRDFKKGLNERTMPSSLKSMNRIIFIILLLTIIMGVIVL